MSYRSYLYIVGCFLGAVLLYSSCSVKARIKKADKKYAIGEYYDAGEIYKKCLPRISRKTAKPLKAYVAFRLGECNRILNNTNAANNYKNAITYKYEDSIVFLRYAQVLHYQGKYEEAKKNYALYEKSHPDDYVTQKGLEACDAKASWRKNEDYSQYTIRFSKEFNKKNSSSICPAFASDDENVIFFSSNRQIKSTSNKKTKRNSAITGKPLFGLYMSKRNIAGKWGDVEKVEGLTNEEEEAEGETDSESESNDSVPKPEKTKMEMGACCFAPDGKVMFLTYSCPTNGQDLGAKIYMSVRASSEWSEPQELKIFKDSSITVAHPTLNARGDTMYFVSDAPGGFGGMDIWMVEFNGSTWENPQNLGPSINTSENEMFPYMRHDGVLFFSSKGHIGFGGLDVFEAVRDTVLIQDSSRVAEYKKWHIRNLGHPFNTNADDFGMTFVGKSGRKGYFSSNRSRGQSKPAKYDAIYSFELPEVQLAIQGKVTDNNGELLSDAFIRIVGDDGTNTKLQVRKDGTYKVKLNKEARYVLLGGARGYLNQKQEAQTLNITGSKILTQNFTLSPIFKPVPMNNVFYEFGKWELTKESEEGLQYLVKLLNDNPNITIELSAHTDIVGDAKFNLELSQKRAKAVVDYLIRVGIAADRLTPVGYGKNKPVIVDEALHKRHSFLPIGQELNETFILGLSNEQQEICNQINRRTEFKVLKTTYKLY